MGTLAPDLIAELRNPDGRVKSITIDTAFYAKNINYLSSHIQSACCGRASKLVGYRYAVTKLNLFNYRIEYE